MERRPNPQYIPGPIHNFLISLPYVDTALFVSRRWNRPNHRGSRTHLVTQAVRDGTLSYLLGGSSRVFARSVQDNLSKENIAGFAFSLPFDIANTLLIAQHVGPFSLQAVGGFIALKTLANFVFNEAASFSEGHIKFPRRR